MIDLVQRAQRTGSPVLDGNDAVFVWLGEEPPTLEGEFNHWGRSDATFEKLSPGVWIRRIGPLPADAYFEYVLSLNGERVRDPLNRRVTSNGMGAYNNSFYMRDAGPSPLARKHAGVPHGRVTRHTLYDDFLVVGGHRDVYLYHPPSTDRVPLLLVWDGREYVRRVRLPVMLDNLIAQGRIPPMAMAMVQHGMQARYVEYCCSDSTLEFVGKHVIPLARDYLNLTDPAQHPGSWGVLGASLGGLMAMYTGLRSPDVFGRVYSQSGSFVLTSMNHPSVLWDLARHNDPAGMKICLDVGRFEALLPSNSEMHDLLMARGFEVEFRIHNTAHNYPAWRDHVAPGLEWLFGPGAITT